jgi:hypothetical protein
VDELEMLKIFYPAVAARIIAIEERVKAAGHTRCEWGKTYGEEAPAAAPGPLCVGCVGQMPLIKSESAA